MTTVTSGTALRNKKMREPYLFLMPALIVLILIDVLPLLYTVGLSLTNFHLARKEWFFVGINNYIKAINTALFWQSFRNNMFWIVGTVVFPLIIGIFQAILVNRPIAGQTFFRIILFTPWVLPSIVTALMWKLLLHPQLGAIDRVLMAIGVMKEPIVWLSDPKFAMLAVTLAGAWKANAFFTLMILAGLQAIPTELYEAAKAEGASAFQSFWYVTLPGLRLVMFVAALMQTIWMLNWMDLVWALTKGGPVYYTQILTTYAYTEGFVGLNFGYSATISVIILIIGGVLGFTLIRLFKPSAESMLA